MICARVFHQMIGRRPITMTVEQRANDAPVQNARKRFVLRLRLPFGDDFAVFGKTADPQAFVIRRPATPTRIFGSVLLLKRLLHDDGDLKTGRPDPGTFAIAVQCKANAGELTGCCRVVQRHARTNPPRAMRQTMAYSTPARNRASRKPAPHKDRHSRTGLFRDPSLLPAFRK